MPFQQRSKRKRHTNKIISIRSVRMSVQCQIKSYAFLHSLFNLHIECCTAQRTDGDVRTLVETSRFNNGIKYKMVSRKKMMIIIIIKLLPSAMCDVQTAQIAFYSQVSVEQRLPFLFLLYLRYYRVMFAFSSS